MDNTFFEQHLIQIVNSISFRNQKIEEFKKMIANENAKFIGNIEQLDNFTFEQNQKVTNYINQERNEEEKDIIHFLKTYSHMVQKKVIEKVKENIVQILSFELFEETYKYLLIEGSCQEIADFINKYTSLLSQKENDQKRINNFADNYKNEELVRIQEELADIKTTVTNNINNFIGNIIACEKNRNEQQAFLEQVTKKTTTNIKNIYEERKKIKATFYPYNKREFDVRINYLNHVQRNYPKFEMYKKAIQNLESRGVFKNILEQYPEKKNVKFELYLNRNAYNSYDLNILSNIFEPIMEQKSTLFFKICLITIQKQSINLLLQVKRRVLVQENFFKDISITTVLHFFKKN